MSRKNNGKGTLEDSRQLLSDTNSQVEKLRRQRANELRGAADNGELDKLDAEIQRLELLASRHAERIKLLEAEAAEAEAQRRVKEKEALIERIEKKANAREAAALEIAEGIAKADAGLRKLLETARDLQAGWGWQAHDLPAILVSPSAIVTAIQHELFRLGARPLLGGGMDRPGAGVNFPGGKAPRLEIAGLPNSVPALVERMKEASASKIMRSGKSTADVVPADTPKPGEPRERTSTEMELSQLLQKQSQLASDISPAGEAAYQNICAEIARVSALVEADKKMGIPT
jgi:hypothetical protein